MKDLKKKNKKKWTRPRHKAVRFVLGAFFLPYVKIKYGIKIKKFNNPEKRPHLILYNHQTAYDQFFVGGAFREPVYYVATEDIFSMGFVSKLIKFLVEPIPIKKQTNDARAVINCIKVAKEGGTIAIAPEGNRTYSGRTEHIKPSITGLARHLGLPIAIFRIEGGYGVHPRWSDTVRRGGMTAGVSRVIEPEEYKDMSDDELYEMICSELYCDEATADKEYTGKRLAEYLERAIYVCDDCGLSTFESRGDIIECKRCSKKWRYTKTKELVGVGFESRFRFVGNWYDYQADFINSLDPTSMGDAPLYEESATLSEVLLYDRKKVLHKNATVTLYPTKVSIIADGECYEFPFDSASALAVLGKNKLNIYYGKQVYQLKGDEHFCALKYVNLYYRYKNVIKGEENAKFLGL